jgi:hypothetical protein
VGKLILISLLFATLIIPMRAARDPSPGRGFRRVLLTLVSFNALYLFLILYIYPRFA